MLRHLLPVADRSGRLERSLRGAARAVELNMLRRTVTNEYIKQLTKEMRR